MLNAYSSVVQREEARTESGRFGTQDQAVATNDSAPKFNCLAGFAGCSTFDELGRTISEEDRGKIVLFDIADILEWESCDSSVFRTCRDCDCPVSLGYKGICSVCRSEFRLEPGPPERMETFAETVDRKRGDYWYQELSSLDSGEQLREPGEVCFYPNGQVVHEDGHHRLAKLIDLGFTQIPYRVIAP
jgi:hypothetical protein